MRAETNIVYDKEDFDALENMSLAEIIETLEQIKRGWLPQSYVYDAKEWCKYSESEYSDTKLHVALSKAIVLLSKIEA